MPAVIYLSNLCKYILNDTLNHYNTSEVGIIMRANGGLAGSDVRVLSISPIKCTVTGIDNHEVPGLDSVQCAAQLHTDHGIVNLIMNEYTYYDKGHTIHSS